MTDTSHISPDSELSPDNIDPRYASHLTTQSYGKARPIEGVRLIDLRHLIDDGGSFAELLRLGSGGIAEQVPGFVVRQVSFSVVQPGIVKAFHLHYKQDDLWFVPPNERMLVGLLDTRRDSATVSVSQRLILGAGRAQLLLIPKGVAHGVMNQLPHPRRSLLFRQPAVSNRRSRRASLAARSTRASVLGDDSRLIQLDLSRGETKLWHP